MVTSIEHGGNVELHGALGARGRSPEIPESRMRTDG
jgi:hypothetical protein